MIDRDRPDEEKLMVSRRRVLQVAGSTMAGAAVAHERQRRKRRRRSRRRVRTTPKRCSRARWSNMPGSMSPAPSSGNFRDRSEDPRDRRLYGVAELRAGQLGAPLRPYHGPGLGSNSPRRLGTEQTVWSQTGVRGVRQQTPERGYGRVRLGRPRRRSGRSLLAVGVLSRHPARRRSRRKDDGARGGLRRQAQEGRAEEPDRLDCEDRDGGRL